MDEVSREDADLVWLIYDLQLDPTTQRYRQKLLRSVYTQFQPSLKRITVAVPGNAQDFVTQLQKRLALQLGAKDLSLSEADEIPDAVQDEDELA